MSRAVVLGAGVIGVGAALTSWFRTPEKAPSILQHEANASMPSRDEQMLKLQGATAARPFDILIIGGGATGTGCALDAVSRGLQTALIEQEDFGAGTSSRSTKLVHGGVRYLEKAVFNLDYGQLKLVFEALHERKRLLENAPHLTRALPIMTPCYALWEVPYYWLGLKAYDAVAGSQGLTLSRYVTPKESCRQFPTLAAGHGDGKQLKGTVVYYDGQFDDARLNVALACTAASIGAAVVNHTKCTKLLKDGTGSVIGMEAFDEVTGKTHQVHAKVVINAGGPFSDSVRWLADPAAPATIMPSSGVHVTLPDYYSPENMGLIVPKTKDGRVVFMLPWQGATIAGTTDSSAAITMTPQPMEEEIQFILDAIAEYLTVTVRRSDVTSAWSGIRPLAVDPSAADTASALRDHLVLTDESGLITVTGGKWTTYRLMAQDAVDACLTSGKFPHAGPCATAHLQLRGARGYTPSLFTQVAQNYTVPHRPGAIDTAVAKHLTAAYGSRAQHITNIAEVQKLGHRLVRGHPQLEAEVVYAAREEMCESAVDFLARRTRLAFLDIRAAEEALPRVIELLADEKKWSHGRRHQETVAATAFLRTFYAER